MLRSPFTDTVIKIFNHFCPNLKGKDARVSSREEFADKYREVVMKVLVLPGEARYGSPRKEARPNRQDIATCLAEVRKLNHVP